MSRRKPAVSKFTGDLAKPITVSIAFKYALDPLTAQVLPLGTKKIIDDAQEHIWSERNRKLQLLLAHYGLENADADWSDLLLHVCSDLIEGFKIEFKGLERRGRKPNKHGAKQNLRLIADVEAVMAEKNCKQRAALKHLVVTRAEYNSTGRIPRSSETIARAVRALETRLSEAHKMAEWVQPTISKLRKLGKNELAERLLRGWSGPDN